MKSLIIIFAFAFQPFTARTQDSQTSKASVERAEELVSLGFSSEALVMLKSIRLAQFAEKTDVKIILANERHLFELASGIDDDQYKAEVYNNLGYDLTVSGTANLDSAIKLVTIANNIYAEKQKNKGHWNTLMNLCWQYRLKGNLDESVSMGKLSVEQAIRENDRHAIIEASIQLGESFIEMGRFPEAGDYFNTALDWSFKDNDRDKFVFDVFYGKYLWETGNRKEAVSLIESAVNFLQTSEVFYEMRGRALLSSYYLELGMEYKAEEHLSEIESPRHNYIAFETLFLSACSRAVILHNQKQSGNALRLLETWSQRACTFGSSQLVRKAYDTRNRIFSAG